eukprot:3544429-Rhodomonas_salina.2
MSPPPALIRPSGAWIPPIFIETLFGAGIGDIQTLPPAIISLSSPPISSLVFGLLDRCAAMLMKFNPDPDVGQWIMQLSFPTGLGMKSTPASRMSLCTTVAISSMFAATLRSIAMFTPWIHTLMACPSSPQIPMSSMWNSSIVGSVFTCLPRNPIALRAFCPATTSLGPAGRGGVGGSAVIASNSLALAAAAALSASCVSFQTS